MTEGRGAGFSHIRRQWFEAGEEPVLAELLADPLLHLVMRRDGVSMAELCNRIAEARTRLGLSRYAAGPCRCAA